MALRIVVLGSLVVDLPLWLSHIPANGETILAERSGFYVGGKGANQAVQIRRLGGHPVLIGKVGADPLGQFLRDGLRQEGMDITTVLQSPSAPTSYAVPVIAPGAQYILHVPGANRDWTADDLEGVAEVLDTASMLLVQGEISPEMSVAAMERVRARGGLILLDPAPVTGVTPAMLSMADVLTPNQVEMAQLLGHPEWAYDVDRLTRHASDLFSVWPNLRLVMVTLGADGVLFVEPPAEARHIPAPTIEAMDPTAAGDAFNGAWAWAVDQGWDGFRAAQLGVKVGSLAASRPGALQSLPFRQDVEDVIRSLTGQ
ncbi:MAG: ribokinase [Sulfobacillus sp.]|nr:ribokinase [Sulfobacillus sp.]